MGLHAAICTTYILFGLMHEVMHYYVGCLWLTREVIWFIVFCVVCLYTRIQMKKVASRIGWKLGLTISILLTIGFVNSTGIYLCYGEVICRVASVRDVEEYTTFVDYVPLKSHYCYIRSWICLRIYENWHSKAVINTLSEFKCWVMLVVYVYFKIFYILLNFLFLSFYSTSMVSKSIFILPTDFEYLRDHRLLYY